MTLEAPSLIDRLAKLLGIAASACLAASLVYDWGYYYVLDLSLSDVPTSLSDHTRTAFNWIPKTAFFWCVGVIIGLYLRRHDRLKKLGDTQTERSPSSFFSRWLTPSLLLLYCWLLWLALLIILGEKFLPVWAWTSLFLWPAIAARILAVPHVVERLPGWAAQVLTTVPALFIFAWITGYTSATSAISRAPTTELKLVGAPTQTVTVLRYLERGIIFRSTTGALQFKQWTAVETVERPSDTSPWKGVVCEWFGKTCNAYRRPASTVNPPPRATP